MDENGFRHQPKEPFRFLVPIGLAGLIRKKAAKERRSLSSVGAELLARGLEKSIRPGGK